tara:strand:+ start:307 stop:699 length:393 start_codon:yes stop_codon:yes gene_type:complete
MNVYSDRVVKVDLLADLSEISYDTLIYTESGIYKKYKKHFFLYKNVSDTRAVTVDGDDYLVELQISGGIDKTNLLTSIPYNCFFVNRVIKKKQLNDYITVVQEIDNDLFESNYFVLSEYDKIESIRSYLE